MGENTHVIEMLDIRFVSRGKNIIEGASVEIDEGRGTAFAGKAGSGKSVLLKLAAGLLRPSAGRVLFSGADIWKMGRNENMAFRKECAFVFQDAALWANQSLKQNMELPLLVHFPAWSEKERTERIRVLCGKFGFENNLSLRPADLSAGERKLAGFVRALLCSPRILFLDSCTEMMDERACKAVYDFIGDFLDKGGTVVCASNDGNFIDRFCSVRYIVEKGAVAQRLEGKA